MLAPGRYRRVLAAIGATIGLAAVFITAAVSAVIIHLPLAPSRRLLQGAVNKGLGSALVGKVTLGEIDRVTSRGVDVRSVTAVDPWGDQVVRASGIHIRVDALPILRSAVFGRGDIGIAVNLVRVDDAAVEIKRGPDGAPTLASTFTPRIPPGAEPSKGRGVGVSLPKIEIGHAWIYGQVVPDRSLDADVSRLAASLQAGAKGVTLDVAQTGIVDRALLPAALKGSANAHLEIIASPSGLPQVGAWTAFSGQLGEIEVQARADLEGRKVSGKVDVPKVAPEQLKTVLPGSPILRPLSASLGIEGELPMLGIEGRVSIDGGDRPLGAIDIFGRLDVAGAPKLEIDVHANDVDPAAFAPLEASLPINAAGRIRADLGEPLRAQAEVSSEPFSLAGNFVPGADVHVVLDRGVLYGAITVHEPGAPTAGTFVASQDAGVRFDVTSEIPSLEAVPRINAKIKGGARVRVNGSVRAGGIDAQVSGGVADLSTPDDIALEEGRISGRITGRADAPTAAIIDATVTGKKLRAADYSFDRVKVRASGPVAKPRVEARLVKDGPDPDDPRADAIKASGELDAVARSVRDVKVRIKKDGTTVEGEIDRVSASPGGVALDGIHLAGKGAGRITGGLRIAGKELAGKIHGEEVDLERVGKLLGIKRKLGGLTDFDIALQPTRKGRKGHVQIAVEDGAAKGVSGVSALFNASFDDDNVKADGLVRLIAHADKGDPAADRCDGSIAQVQIDGAEGKIPGPLLDPRTWERMTGRARVAADDWNLRCISKLAPLERIVSDVRGMLDTHFVVERPEGQRFASVHDVLVRTRGLELAGPFVMKETPITKGPEAGQSKPVPVPAWESRGLDFQIQGKLAGDTGKLETATKILDGGVLGEASLNAALDLPTIWDKPDQRKAAMRSTPIEGHLSIPRRPFRDLSSLPTFVREELPPLSGDIKVSGFLDGTIDNPFAVLHAEGFHLAHTTSIDHPAPTPYTLPIDLDALATYEDKRVSLEASASHRGKAFFTSSAEVDLHPKPEGSEGAPWTGGAFVQLTDAPIGRIPFLDDRDIDGHLSGSVSLSGLGDKPRLKIDLSSTDLEIGQDLAFDHGKLSVEIDDHAGAVVKAELVDKKQGRLDVSGFAGIRWQGGVAPAIDVDRPADLRVKAFHVPLATFYPALAGTLSKLDGKLDGTARLGWTELGDGDKGELAIDMKVTDGVFHVPQLGQEFRHVTATIAGDRSGTIRVSDLSADGQRGQIKGSATAKLSGLVFQSADAKLTIAEGKEIPVTLEGVPFGMARGEIDIHADKRDRALEITATIPEMHLDLPAASARSVQSLDDDPNIATSHPLDQGMKDPRPDDALAIIFTSVIKRLDVVGSGIDMSIQSAKDAPPRVEITDKPRISGDINLIRGTFVVMSKSFDIERGMVRLRPEDPGNPYINVHARWDSPDGRVYVDYAGVLFPITSDKLKFTSDPPRTQQEILALLLFGGEQYSTVAGGETTSGAGPSAQQVASGVAVGVGGGVVAQQFNALLSGIAPLKNFSTQFSAADDGTIRPSLAYTLGDKLHVVATYDASSGSSTSSTATGAGASSTGAGTTARTTSQTVVNLDWRFKPNWLLRGTLSVGGDQTSTGVDLLWQYRY